MGRRRCIVPGCQSTHSDGNTESERKDFRLFAAPKDCLEEWSNALMIKNFVLRPNHLVCMKHFADDDILRRKNIYGPDGSVLGISADFPRPRLRKGAVPTLNLGYLQNVGHEETAKSQNRGNREIEESRFLKPAILKRPVSKLKIEVTRKVDHVEVPNLNPQLIPMKEKSISIEMNNDAVETHDKENKNDETKHISMKEIEISIENNNIDENNEKTTEVVSQTTFDLDTGLLQNNDACEEVPGDLQEYCPIDFSVEIRGRRKESLFDLIYKNEKSVSLPLQWSRQNMKHCNKKMVLFCHFVPRIENDVMESICVKQVIIDEDMKQNIFVIRQKIKAEDSKINNTLTSVYELERTLIKVNSWKICKGLEIKSNEEIQAPCVWNDKEGTLRNEKCTLFMSHLIRSIHCIHCKRSKRLIETKVRRMRNCRELKRLRLNLNSVQRKKFNEMMGELRALRRAKERSSNRLKLLKEWKIKMKRKLLTRQKSLDQLLLESDLTPNQKLVTREIVFASKQSSANARRYTKPWISFCIILYKRSPVIYRFLRDNDILPLPAPATVAKYHQKMAVESEKDIEKESPDLSKSNTNLDAVINAVAGYVSFDEDDIILDERMSPVAIDIEIPAELLS